MPVLAAVTAAMLAVYPPSPIYGPPAPAPRTTPSYNPDIGREVREVRSDIEHGRASGQLSHRQARHLKREAGELRTLEERYTAGGLSDTEQAELRIRVEALRALTNAKRVGTIK